MSHTAIWGCQSSEKIVKYGVPQGSVLQQIALDHSSSIEFKDFMKLYKDYTKPFSFLVRKSKQSTTSQAKQNPIWLRQTAKILALSSGNVGKYEFLTSEYVLPEKGLLEKAATIKRFEYSPLCSELKKNKKQKNLAMSEINISFLKIKWMLLIIAIEKMM